jgi:hypothetical protein
MPAAHASTTATERTGALPNIRVIDFGHSMAAPLAGMLLADQGATVIKVERPQGDPARVHPASLNFSQFVEGRRWWSWAREGFKGAHGFAGDEPCTGEETCRASARFDALQNVINSAF